MSFIAGYLLGLESAEQGQISPLVVKKNGSYRADRDIDGFSPVTVDVPIIEKTITKNGTYYAADDGAEGFDPVNVQVPDRYADGVRDGYKIATGEVSEIYDISGSDAISLMSITNGGVIQHPTNGLELYFENIPVSTYVVNGVIYGGGSFAFYLRYIESKEKYKGFGGLGYGSDHEGSIVHIISTETDADGYIYANVSYKGWGDSIETKRVKMCTIEFMSEASSYTYSVI